MHLVFMYQYTYKHTQMRVYICIYIHRHVSGVFWFSLLLLSLCVMLDKYKIMIAIISIIGLLFVIFLDNANLSFNCRTLH